MPQKFIFTTSPWKDQGRNKWMLSLFISIQLDAGQRSQLSAFPDILSWMQKIADGDFFIQWDKNAPVAAEPISAKWDPELYSRLFHGEIQVKTFTVPDVSKFIIKSYPALHIRNYILDTYKEVGNLKMDELPTASFYTKQFTKLNEVSTVQLKNMKPLTGTTRKAVINDFVVQGNTSVKNAQDQLRNKKTIGFNATASPKADFGQFHNFHQRVDMDKLQMKPIRKPEFEYHDMLSILTSYPVIMRKLGLVIDFELNAAPPAAAGTVRILPANLGLESESTLSSPATAYQYTGKGFYAAAKAGSQIDKGYLSIGGAGYEVVQIDTDGAAMKLSSHVDTVNLNLGKRLVDKSNYIRPLNKFSRNKNVMLFNAGKISNLNAAPPADDDDDDDDPEEGLPSLRSAGIGILKNGLAETILQKFIRSVDLTKITFASTAVLNNQALLNTAVSKTQVTPTAPTTQPAVPNPPTKKTGGIAPIRMKRQIPAVRMQALTAAFQKIEYIPVPTEFLYADDLVFGYRLDIAYDDKPDTWYSLHKRKMSFAFAPVDQPVQPITLEPGDELDEGCIHLALTEDEEDGDEKKVNEVIARWEGWSLSVPRIGKGINNAGPEVSSDEDEKKKYKLDKETPFRLQVEVKPAPKSLPKLRFGKKYRIKVRTVDIAGNGVSHDVQPESPSQTIRSGIEYRRFEPLSSPVLLQGDEITGGDKKMIRDRDGESLQHMVIRSNAGVDTKTYEDKNITTVVVDGSAKGTLKYHHEAVRFITAPRGSQQLAEIHGMFDEAMSDPQKAMQAYQFITSRDKEYKDDGKTKAVQIPVETGQVDIDYLADPLAGGVVFTMRSNTSFETPWKKGQSRKFSFHFDDEVSENDPGKKYSIEQWKNPRSVKIRLVEGNGEPEWKNRVFTIPLPKASIVEISYASFWAPEALERFSGLMPRLQAGANGVKVKETANKGLHWMFSPWRKIRLVHAVQQPLEAPVMAKISKVERDYNDTAAQLLTLIKVHGASTEKMDLGAKWTEWVDDLSKPEPFNQAFSTHVETVPVVYNDNMLELIKTPATKNPKPDWLPPITHLFGDTKYRHVGYIPSATTRFREYFTGIIDTGRIKGEPVPLSREGEVVELDILSTARPTVPVLEYVVPGFVWSKPPGRGRNKVNVRSGTIRVYLRRPWYSSGDDERIAVILPPEGLEPERHPEYKKYCTVWGMDPVFETERLPNSFSNYPRKNHFVGTDVIYDTVKLAEENVPVQVAAYKVFFDKEKQLHYADIRVDAGNAYFPFVRLMLARYQQHSLRENGTDVCLSQSVQADWIQQVPLRQVSFEELAGSFRIQLQGPSAFRSGGRVRINITVEKALVPKTDNAFIGVNVPGEQSVVFTRDYNLDEKQLNAGKINFEETVRVTGAGNQYRVVVREYELHPNDPLLAKPNIQGKNADTVGERLVFMEVFE